MADLVGFASTIVQLADFSWKVVTRLNEFHSNAKSLPKSLYHIKSRLPLLANTVGRVKAQAETGCFDIATRAAIQEAVDGSFNEIKLLDSLLDEILPKEADPKHRKVHKAILSLRCEEKIQNIDKRLNNYIQVLTFHQTAPTPTPILEYTGALFIVPFERDTKFIGRVDIIQKLDDKFGTGRRAALSGNHKSQNRAIIQEIARKAKLPGHEDPKADILRLVFDWLSEKSAPQHLIIFDNVDDIEELPQPTLTSATIGVNCDFFIPRSENGKVLITTRDRRVGMALINGEEPVDVFPFTVEDARKLLQSRISSLGKGPSQSLDDLISDLDHLPLAITQAAAFINENEITIEDYLKTFRDDDLDRRFLLSQELVDLRRSGDTPNAVFRSMKLSFDQITRQMPEAAEMLSLMAVLDRQGIPELILRTFSSSSAKYMKSTGTLMAFSLITKEKGDSSFKIHRLVKECMQHWLKLQNELQRWQSCAIKILAGVFPAPNLETKELCENLHPHVQVALQYTVIPENIETMQARLLSFSAHLDYLQGRYDMALSKSKRATSIRIKTSMPNHPATNINDTFEQMLCLQELGRYKESEALCRILFAKYERTRGTYALDTIYITSSLAVILLFQQKYEEAERLHRRGFQDSMVLYGPKIQITLDTMTDFSLTLSGRNKFHEAEALLRHVLMTQEENYADDSTSSTTLYTLGDLLHETSRFEEAEKTLRKAVIAYQKLLGADHPRTFCCFASLMRLLIDKDEFEEAESLGWHLFARATQTLGPGHHQTTCSLLDLGYLMFCSGVHQTAHEFFERVLQNSTTSIGEDQFTLLSSVKTLMTWNLFMQNKHWDAHDLCKQMVQENEMRLERLDPDRLKAYSLLGIVLQCEGHYEEAEGMHRKASEGWKELLGENDWATKTSLKDLNLALRCQGKETEVEDHGDTGETDAEQVWVCWHDYSKPGPHRKHICHWRDRVPPKDSNTIGQQEVDWDKFPSAVERLSIGEAMKQCILSNGERVER